MSSSTSKHLPRQPPRPGSLWRLDVLSTGECNTTSPAPPLKPQQLTWTSLPSGRGLLATTPSSQAEARDVPDDTKRRYLSGGYLAPPEGFWLVYLDGMRWYPSSPDFVKFGSATRRTPRFLNSDGDALGPTVSGAAGCETPMFSYIPRNLPVWDGDDRTSSSLAFDEPRITRVYVKDGREVLVVPNGRLMVWVRGPREDVPLDCLNALRRHAGVINTPEPLEKFPSARWAVVAEVPAAIRRVVWEMGEVR